MRLRAVAAAIVLALALSAGAAGGNPLAVAAERASLADIEDEVMCLQCGTALNLSTAPVANREREFIRREIARGKSKAQIKDELVAAFGPSVLAVPENKGFGLAATVVPLLVALLGLITVVVAARRWRRPAQPPEAPPELDPRDASALERQLEAFDRRR
jgi:cytochrome c-type biogenesis protein CcmH